MKLASDPQALLGRAPSPLLLAFPRLTRLSVASCCAQGLPGADRVPDGECQEHEWHAYRDRTGVQGAVDRHDRGDHHDRRQRPHDQRALAVAEERDREELHGH
jgi:hypothetical protein